MSYEIAPDPEYGYLRVSPLPSEEEVSKYYKEEFYSRKGGSGNNSSLENMIQEGEFHRRSYYDLLAILETQCASSNRGLKSLKVVDVGCGYGYWLKFLNERGIVGYGIEPVDEGVDHCRSMGLEAYTVQIEDLDAPPVKVDVDIVSMLNVLEHLREPANVLRSFAKNWLSPGGLLLLRVPNDFNPLQMAANQVHDLNKWWVHPPAHINYFSPQSLASLVEQCGFDVCAVTGSFPLEIFLLMNDVYVGSDSIGKACHAKRVAFERNLEATGQTDLRRKIYSELIKLGIGRDIVLLARRK